jgi:hypothetical protein
MTDKLDNSDVNARQVCIRASIDTFEVDEKAIHVGSKDILQAAIAGKQITNRNVYGFVLNGSNLARHPE